MPEAIAFDSHRFVKRLTESGFTERQAETLAEEHVALLNANLATKDDVAALKVDVAELKADVEVVKTDVAELKADVSDVKLRIEAARADLLKWMFGALVAQGGMIVALVKLL